MLDIIDKEKKQLEEDLINSPNSETVRELVYKGRRLDIGLGKDEKNKRKNNTFAPNVYAEKCKKYLDEGNEKIPQDAFCLVGEKKCSFGKWFHNHKQKPVEERKSTLQTLLKEIAEMIPDPSDKKGVL